MMRSAILSSVVLFVRGSSTCPSESSSTSSDAHALLQVQQRVKQRSPLSMDEDPSKTIQSPPEHPSVLLELQPASTPACVGGGYQVGDGSGGSEQKIGDADSPEHCITMVKELCPTANGATLPGHGSGPCYCEYGMTGVSRASHWWQTCEFAPDPAPAPAPLSELNCDAFGFACRLGDDGPLQITLPAQISSGSCGVQSSRDDGFPDGNGIPSTYCPFCRQCCDCNANLGTAHECEHFSVLAPNGAVVPCSECESSCSGCPEFDDTTLCPNGDCCGPDWTYHPPFDAQLAH
jgi:hypothetical protein